MAGPVSDTHRITYRENIILALQERKAIFDDAFMFDGGLKGKQVQMTDIIGATEARVDAPEGGDTPDVEATHEPVWVRPRRIDWGKVIKKEDQIKALTDYKSEYVQGGALAVVRKKNIILSDAFFNARLIGSEVPVATPWAGSTVPQTVGSDDGSTAVGMNVKKILRAFKLLEDKEIVVEEEDIYLALDPQEIEDLYYDLTYVNKDYRSKAVLEEKRVLSILGIPIIPTKRIADDSANVSAAALWCKSGMVWGEFDPVSVKSEPNPAKQYREHPYIETWIGATRLQDEKVIKILNKQG
ncbi:phage capsid protein [Bosea minatitlanensis]|uniref:Phage capsid protein n=1 Tax=Bosea minatitlanensis TaxID=128782 RepID=A0ABW0EVY4_9HYPH|nr:phage capsid protein [Bosea minatitlanensis]MCT4495396.1 phage capsid protein [Bosea minatitlanensis]